MSQRSGAMAASPSPAIAGPAPLPMAPKPASGTSPQAGDTAQPGTAGPDAAALAGAAGAAAPSPAADIAEAPVPAAAAGVSPGWRAAAAILFLLAAGLGGLLAYREWGGAATAGHYVAVLQAEPGPSVSFRVDPATGAFRARALAADPPEGRVYQLWLVTGSGAIVPLGRFSTSMTARSAALRGLDAAALRAAQVHVTLEPAEMITPPTPGGAVVLKGALVPE